MKKGIEILKDILIILIIVLLSLIAFFGIFGKDKGIWSNLVPDYKYGMELDGTRELKFTLNDEEEEKYVYVDENGNVVSEVWEDGSALEDDAITEDLSASSTDESEEENSSTYKKEKRTIKSNEDSNLTKENFEKAKKIIVNRLKNQGIEEYNIRVDDITGKMVIETKNNDEEVGKIENIVNQIGKLQILDYQNGELLIDNSDIKDVSAIYTTSNGYQTYLQIEFNKEGSQKLKDISNKYVEVKKETTDSEDSEETEDSEESEESTIYKVVLQLDDSKLLTTYFGEEMSNGILQITIGDSTTDSDEFKEYYENALLIANILNTGILPIDYELETDNYVKAEIGNTEKIVTLIIALGLILAVSVFFIIKFKLNGLYASILSIGYIAVLSIVSRYTNVLLTINSIIAYAVLVALNYVFMYELLKSIKNENAFWSNMKEFFLKTLPVSIATMIFVFTKLAVLNSVGMIAFWGMILIAVYNMIFTKWLLKK